MKIEIKDIENNIYYKDNPKFFLELMQLVKEYPCHFSRILKYTKKDLKAWIDNSLPLLNDDFHWLSTKVNWILNGRTSFPKCEVCGRSEKYYKKNVSAGSDYAKTCCPSCSKKHPDTIAKTKATNLRIRGTEYTFQSEEVKDKIYDTMSKKYGYKTRKDIENAKLEKLKNKCNITYNMLNVKNVESNVYYKDNPQFFLELTELVNKHPRSYGTILMTTKKEILKWIDLKLPLLQNPFYKISTKIHWILRGFTTFPICPICGKDDNYKSKNITLALGYKHHCSDSCALKDQAIQKAIRATCKSRYGNEFPQRLPEIKQKAIETCIAKFGVSNAAKSDKIKEKIATTNKQRYGVSCPFKSAEIKAKIAATNEKTFGSVNPFGSKQIQTQIRQTNLKKFGVENPSLSDAIKAKKIATCNKNYGVSNPMQCSEIRALAQSNYTYDNMQFATIPEIAYYIWLKDNNICFVYLPNKGILYEYNGKIHMYMPDFKVNEQLVEIKGSHLVKEDGTWQCPYDHKMDGQAEAKHQCALANNVKIMYEDEYQKFIKYVEDKYGRTYLKQFKNTKSS